MLPGGLVGPGPLPAQCRVGGSYAVSQQWFEAVLLDLDGVLTETATLHYAAWSEAFATFAHQRPETHRVLRGDPLTYREYLAYVDGRSRLDGALTLLVARGAVSADVVHWGQQLAADKDRRYENLLQSRGVRAFPDATTLLARLTAAGVSAGVVSASHHCRRILTRIGVADNVAVVVDGEVADTLHLPGKPHPALFLEAAARLDVIPQRCVVVEDATVGVESARRGGFGLVIGLDRAGARRQQLIDAGADQVTRSLGGIAV